MQIDAILAAFFGVKSKTSSLIHHPGDAGGGVHAIMHLSRAPPGVLPACMHFERDHMHNIACSFSYTIARTFSFFFILYENKCTQHCMFLHPPVQASHKTSPQARHPFQPSVPTPSAKVLHCLLAPMHFLCHHGQR
mmetsp:Transcript_32010/g.63453  ORF Transcript_32010/g.63453 Transcript_32010/m.63453 type:complete len:136 (+) Transcript_32010:468-875(+)